LLGPENEPLNNAPQTRVGGGLRRGFCGRRGKKVSGMPEGYFGGNTIGYEFIAKPERVHRRFSLILRDIKTYWYRQINRKV